jgi:hypothetical protein
MRSHGSFQRTLAALVWIGGAVLVLSAVVFILNRRSEQRADAEWAVRAKDRHAALLATRRAEARFAAARAQINQLRAARAATKANATKPAGKEKRPIVSIADQLERNPAAQVAALASERAHVLATYGPLFRRLGLTPEEIGRFQEIVFKRKEQEMDIQAIVRADSLVWTDPAVQKLEQKVRDKYAADARALLGDERYQQFSDYDRASWIHELMIGWAGGATAIAREPLTQDQGDRLEQALANSSESYRNGGYVTTSEPGYWDRVDVEARKILTPSQYVFFTTAEPPLPTGGRFQTQFYSKVTAALKADKKSTAAKPGS